MLYEGLDRLQLEPLGINATIDVSFSKCICAAIAPSKDETRNFNSPYNSALLQIHKRESIWAFDFQNMKLVITPKNVQW
jgi:hypothetical protein